MKIAVVGCGAVGSYYGAMLARAGHDVHFLLRSDYQVVRAHGINVRSPAGDFTVAPFCARQPEEIGLSDLVLSGLKTTANAEYPTLLRGLVADSTTVVTLQNGLGNEEQLARAVAPAQILGGLCFVCLNRIKPGLIHHIAHGLVVIGEYCRGHVAQAERLVAVFRQARIEARVTEDLLRAHWEKLTWNVPFNGLGVAAAAGYHAVLQGRASVERVGACAPTDQLLADPKWEQLVRELINEVVAGAAALGLKLPAGIAEEQIARTRCMGAYKASTLLDFERGQPLELESLFREPLRQARAAGVELPRLAAMCEVLSALENRRQERTIAVD
jgi:2-dehydropantoate 2-reductase